MAQVVKLADALLRRKELNQKLDRIRPLMKEDLFQTQVKRKPITEGLEDVIAEVPLMTWQQMNSVHDYYSKHLRLIDGAIQNANWNTNIEVDEDAFTDFVEEPRPERLKVR